MKIRKPKFINVPRNKELDRIINRVNYISFNFPDSPTRRSILARYEREMDELSKDMLERKDAT